MYNKSDWPRISVNLLYSSVSILYALGMTVAHITTVLN